MLVRPANLGPAPVKIDSHSGPSLAPVMGLTAGIIAEPLVPAALSAFWVSLGKGDGRATMLTPSESAAGGHKPVHLQIHSSQKAVKPPVHPYVGKRVEPDEVS
jgi:hypothetical protein